MKFKLELKQNAFHSIFQALKHIREAMMYKSDEDKDIEFDHEDQMTSYQKDDKFYFYLDDFYYKPPCYYQFKFAILHLIQAIELLLIDIIKSKNIDDIFRDNNKKFTINLCKALDKIRNINPKILTKEQEKTILIYKQIRNKLEHYEIESDYDSLYNIVINLLSIINTIFQLHYDINLKKFYSFDCWKEDFDDTYSDIISEVLSDAYKYKINLNPEIINDWIYKHPDDKLTLCICCSTVSYSIKENRCLYCNNEFDKSTLRLIDEIYFNDNEC